MGNKGFALIGAIMIMTIFAALGLFMVSTLSTDTEIALDTLRSTQAFYIAEAGVKRVFYKLVYDAGYSANPYTITGDIGEGSFSVTVNKDGNTYTLTSTGTVGLVERRLTQTVAPAATAFNFAVFVKGGGQQTLVIKNYVKITGDVYYDGDVEVIADAIVYPMEGKIYATSVTGTGTYFDDPVPPQLNPKPPYPGFDSTWYDAKIAAAKSANEGALTLSGTDELWLLSDEVKYYTEVTVSGLAKIHGPGTIVATGDISLSDSALIENGVKLLTGKRLTMSNSSKIIDGGLLYAERHCILEDSAELMAGNILVPNSATWIKMTGNTKMTGAIYAYRVELSDYANISGSVVTEKFEQNAIGDNVEIAYNPDIMVNLPLGVEGSGGTVSALLLSNDWDEIDPN